jgi:mycofactocin biosynthesis protein MftB
MACAASTDSADPGGRPPGTPRSPLRAEVSSADRFDMDAAWRLAPQVQVRPERFGALLYHFGTRQLSFLKSPALLTVVSSLAGQPTARAACRAAEVPDAELPSYRRALATLAAAQMICRRETA